jgi:hypothetical protein
MQTERVTYLTSNRGKALLARKASAMGVSMGEYLRRRVEDEEDELTPGQDAELKALIAEMNVALPKIQAALDQSSQVLQDLHCENEQFFAERGVR